MNTEDHVVAHPHIQERYLLAACLGSQRGRDKAAKYLTADDFGWPFNADVWSTMRRMDSEGRGVDPASLLNEIIGRPGLPQVLADITSISSMVPENVDEYIRAVRDGSLRRRLQVEAARLNQRATDPNWDPASVLAETVTRFKDMRDVGTTESQALSLAELLADPDDEPDWLIPHLLEKGDRFILTGEEGLGKSHLMRQVAVMAQAGVDPFNPGAEIEPVRVLIIDCENSLRQIKYAIRPAATLALNYGTVNPGMLSLLTPGRLDLTRDRDLARVHREMDESDPELVIIGPLYRLTPRAIQTDDEAAPVLAALDTIRDRGAAMMIEAHAGHVIGKGGKRDLRPRGSSALMGWPEFGYGMRMSAGNIVDMVPWRGDRAARDWPKHVRKCSQGIRWVPAESWVP